MYLPWTYPEAPGVSPLPPNLHGLDRPFPDTMFVLYNADEGKYIVIDAYHTERDMPETFEDGFEGVACFTTEAYALTATRQLERSGVSGFQPMDVTFDEAQAVARERTSDIAALILMDRPGRPIVRYVR